MKRMGRYKYLANNIALFSVSNFVSKILVFLLVPLYTSTLTTKEYGIVSVMQVTMLLLVPALTINIGEGALRFALEREEKRGAILRIGLKYTAVAALIVAAGCILATLFVPTLLKKYLIFFIFLFAMNALYEFLVLFFQGSEMVPIVVCGSIFCTLVMIGSNLLFLLVLKIGLNGYLLAQILSFAMGATLMLLLSAKQIHMQNRIKDQELEAEMLAYGKPLILYSTSSWINNASDRYIVTAMCGSAVNGVYGVAYNIPAILTVFQRIFAQAWQMSATKSHKDEDSGTFFSTMYQTYQAFMVLGCSFLIMITRLLAGFLFQKDFYEAWRFVPPLLISIIFGALTGFLGSICLAHKDSKSMGIATGIGAAVNIVLNILSIPYLGALGAAIATAISYYLMYLIAFLLIRKHVKLSVNLIRDYASYVIVVIQSVLIINEVKYAYPIVIVLFVALILLYLREAYAIAGKLLQYVKQKGKGE